MRVESLRKTHVSVSGGHEKKTLRFVITAIVVR